MISKSKCGHPACNCVPDYTEVESLRRALSQWDLQVLETGPPTRGKLDCPYGWITPADGMDGYAVFDSINVSAPNRNLRELECPCSVVQNYIEQRFANPDTAVVLNKAELAEAIHEEADAGSGGADHPR